MTGYMIRLVFVLVSILGSVSALGQAVRTFVSTAGVDNATCSRTNPCRNFAAAITAVNDGGEVVVLDSGGYGPAVIDQSVSIISPAGIHAAIAPTAGTALEVDPGAAGKVVLRGLYLNSQGATTGINVLTGTSVFVENCVVSGFTGARAVNLNNENGAVYVTDSIVRNTDGSAVWANAASPLRLFFERSRIEGNFGDGIHIENNVTATVHHCLIAGNSNIGVDVAPSGSRSKVNIEGSMLSGHAVGLRTRALGIDAVSTASVSHTTISGGSVGLVVIGSDTNAVSANATACTISNIQGEGVVVMEGGTVRLSGNTIASNSDGVVNLSATVISLGNNMIRGNGTDIDGDPITVVSGN